MDTPTVKSALAAHSNAWSAYNARIADLEASKAAYSKADNVFVPGSPEVRKAEHAVESAQAGVKAARETLRTATSALLALARGLAAEANALWETGEREARALWEKHSVGAKLYDPTARERDFTFSPWRKALPFQRRHEEFPDRIETLPDIGPEFASNVQATAARVAQLRTAVETLRTIKA
jgi:hypothetical protein